MVNKNFLKLHFFKPLADYIHHLKENLREQLRKATNLVRTNLDLGDYHHKVGNHGDAILRYRIVKWLDKDNVEACYKLARGLLILGKKDQAEANLRHALTLNPSHTEAAYLLASLDHKLPKPDSIPENIVKDYFLEISGSYEEEVVRKLGYKAHSIVAEKLKQLGFGENKCEVLDLGCGDGYLAKFLKSKFSKFEFTGVDFVEEMLDGAKLQSIRNVPVYNHLINMDITTFLTGDHEKFDLILAISSFEFSNKLLENCGLLLKHLNTGGKIIITLPKSTNNEDITLSENMRYYVYSKQYIESKLKQANIEKFELSECTIMTGTVAWLITISL